MKVKEHLYAVIGGCVGAVLTMVAGSFSPLGAHNEARDAEFGTITCQEIRVLDPSASFRRGVFMGTNEYGGYVELYGDYDFKGVEMRVLKNGGYIGVHGNGITSARATMKVTEHSGRVRVSDASGQRAAAMETDEHGGRMDVYGRGSYGQLVHATMRVNKDGDGEVNTRDKDGRRSASLR